jgi:predicted  nucleic acid-binding Zn-ribbon protein
LTLLQRDDDARKSDAEIDLMSDVRALQHEVARYKLKSEQLEYKIEEVRNFED